MFIFVAVDILRYVYDLSLQTGTFADPLITVQLLYSKQFVFQIGQSTGHFVAQLVEEFHESFELINKA